ncbi:MAG TPA: aldehyde dehydrogenase family protein [Gammaproteobacteria bacterium]|nr:aldehyde dehydrogenase family protein [Gammaproteobacteria bacterium]
MEKDILKQCKIQPINSGTYSNESWLTSDEPLSNLISINPASEQPIAEVVPTSATQFQKVLTHAQKAAQTWSLIPAPKRGELIRKIGVLLRKNKDFLAGLISLEMGKIKAEAEGEVQEMIDMADFAVGQSRMLYGKTMHSERVQHRMYEQWHPLGVVAVITAFNFPMAVWAWNAFLAAVCGNVVIWKPSSKVPLCAIAVQHLCSRAMKKLGYAGVFSLVITEDKTISEQLLTNKHINLVSFTGSSFVGHKVAESVSKRFGRYLLECSGNNAIIIDKTADLKLAIPAVVFGAVGTSGQRCTTTRRLIVHDSIIDHVIDALKHAYQQIQIGDPLDKKNLMGPLISEDAVNAFTAALAECHKQSAEIITGGSLLPGTGYYVEPTIIRAENHWPIVQEETFAPILYVISFKDFEDAIRLQNTVPQGLSSALFSTQIKNIERFLSTQGSDCGIANINIGTSGAEIGGAFGGEKETGGGREAGSDAWKNYMRRQTNTINWSDKLPLAQGIKFYE